MTETTGKAKDWEKKKKQMVGTPDRMTEMVATEWIIRMLGEWTTDRKI